MLCQTHARCVRSGPALRAQTFSALSSGYACSGWKLAITPSLPKRGISCALMVSICSMRGTSVVSVIGFRGFLIGIQRQPHRLVADGVSENLQSAAVEFGDGLLVFGRLPEQLPDL